MPCDTVLKPRQTLSERKLEVKKTVQQIAEGLASGRIKPVVSRTTGAFALSGITTEERNGVTDACVYRRIMVEGSALAKMAIMRAEQLAGRAVDKKLVAQGVHSHDGGESWHGKG